jgi:5-methylcytosine-specific restriction enzyme subunit McrC
VAFLLAHHRAHLEILPTGRRHGYRLTPAGRAGVVVGPTCRLVIRPKIPLRNVFFLLDPAAPPTPTPDAVTPECAELPDFLAGLLAQRLAERASAGLHRAYAERADQGPFLLGRLDVTAQLRESRRDQLHSRHDAFTADIPCNQLARTTAELLLGLPLLSEEVRAALQRALPAFDGVRVVAATPDFVQRAVTGPAPPDYRPLLDLCRLLVEGLVPGEAAGSVPAPCVLLDLERLFERYVTRGVAEAFAGEEGWLVSAQPTHTVNHARPDQPDIAMRPDATVDRGGRPRLVLDAKWKRLPRAALVTPDLYQVLAYCTALGVGQAVLVYAGRRERVWDYTFPESPVRVSVRTLNVAGSRAACARGARRLGRALRAMASGGRQPPDSSPSAGG